MIDNKLLLLIITLALTWLFYQLMPILTPFIIATLLAYLADPIVDRLETTKISRIVAILIVFFVLSIMMLLVFFMAIPSLMEQTVLLLDKLPDYALKAQSVLLSWLALVGISMPSLDTDLLQYVLTNYKAEVSYLANSIVTSATQSGATILQWLINIVLIPVLTFYLLRDWDKLKAKFNRMLPPRYADRVTRLLTECDTVLAAFMRGQLMVMLALAILYTIGLAIIGIEASLLLGMIAGIVSFVPYLGLIVGIVLAGTVAFFQFYEWWPVLMVIALFGIAQIIEALLLTPRFVGERVGIHPVFVIFSVLAGGQLFGFIGVLLALPVAAVMMVLLRDMYQHYLNH